MRTNGTDSPEMILQNDKKKETVGRIAAGIACSLAIYTHASRDAFIFGHERPAIADKDTNDHGSARTSG